MATRPSGSRTPFTIQVPPRTRDLRMGSSRSPLSLSKWGTLRAVKIFLDTFPYRNILGTMAQAATTTDAFNAIAEPRRRAIIGVLVAVGRHGRRRLYRLNAKELKPVHDWVKTYERFWTHQLDRIKEQAERKMAERSTRETKRSKEKEEGRW